MKLVKSLDLENVVFLDIETVAGVQHLTKEDPMWYSWDYKLRHGREPLDATGSPEELFAEKAALFAEFGKIVCITIGKIKDGVLKLKSYSGHEEGVLLNDFCKTLDAMSAKNKQTVLCGHAIKGFDIPYLIRRCLVNQIELPTLLDIAHLKPWETTGVDTMELWKAGGFSGGSLIAIAVALGLANPKDDIEGHQTTYTYYNEENGLQRIKEYCEKDVLTVANIIRRFRYEPLVTLEESNTAIEVEHAGILERAFNTKKLKKDEEALLVREIQSMSKEEAAIANTILKVVVPKTK